MDMLQIGALVLQGRLVESNVTDARIHCGRGWIMCVGEKKITKDIMLRPTLPCPQSTLLLCNTFPVYAFGDFTMKAHDTSNRKECGNIH